MSYKHVGTAGDLVRFGCALKVECTACGAAWTWNGVQVYEVDGTRQLTQLAPPEMPPLQEKSCEGDGAGPVWANHQDD